MFHFHKEILLQANPMTSPQKFAILALIAHFFAIQTYLQLLSFYLMAASNLDFYWPSTDLLTNSSKRTASPPLLAFQAGCLNFIIICKLLFISRANSSLLLLFSFIAEMVRKTNQVISGHVPQPTCCLRWVVGEPDHSILSILKSTNPNFGPQQQGREE